MGLADILLEDNTETETENQTETETETETEVVNEADESVEVAQQYIDLGREMARKDFDAYAEGLQNQEE